MAKVLFAAVVAVLFAACFGSRLVGAPKKLNDDDNNMKEAVAFAMYEYNKASNDMYASRLVKVHNATVQVVNGLKYDMYVEVGRTECRKPVTNANDCKLHSDASLAKTETCHIQVVNRMWRSEVHLEKMECQ